MLSTIRVQGFLSIVCSGVDQFCLHFIPLDLVSSLVRCDPSCFSDLWTYPSLKQELQLLNVPLLHCPGDHAQDVAVSVFLLLCLLPQHLHQDIQQRVQWLVVVLCCCTLFLRLQSVGALDVYDLPINDLILHPDCYSCL